MYITTREAYTIGAGKYDDLQAAATCPRAPLEVIQAFANYAAHWLPRANEYRRLERIANAAEIKQIRIENDIKQCEEDLRRLRMQLNTTDMEVDAADDEIRSFCMNELAEEEQAAEASRTDALSEDFWALGN